MIYLIDDKKERQHKDFGWSEEKFAQYADYIKPLYSIEEIVQIGENLYKDKNIILYHESFLDFTNDSKKAIEQRSKLQDIVETNKDLSIAFFSGSQGSRSLNNNIAHLPVSILYQNLEIAVKQHIKGSIELQYILFGVNPEIESELNESLIQANRIIENNSIEISGKTLFIHPDEDFIQNAISNAHTEEIYQDKDSDMSEITIKLLNDNEYDNIFIPLCFGPTLSDYNGLRLATHIRCTPTKNQQKRIFIYGFVGLEYLVDHEYFNILKTKNVELVSYSKKAFKVAANKNFEDLKPEELSKEIQKLKIDPPLNYTDSHSIANEWAIHQWAKTIGCDETDELTKVFQNVHTNLYFKYLKTINPISELGKISLDKLNINDNVKPRVLLIDDEADKGWYEIFAYFLGDINGIYTDYLGIDFKKSSSDEIIKKSIEKIFKDEIDIVILDFRLNPSDFQIKNSEKITSVKLLKKIKEKNPGVQVIAFSATNKIWNFQTLQSAGADGFIFKNSTENINQTINDLIDHISLSFKKAYWLIPIYESFDTIKNNAAKLTESFKINLENNLSICFDLIIRSFENDKYLNYAFLQLFLILEEFIKLDLIFDEGSDCFVKHSSGDICVSKRIGHKIECAISLTDNGKYEIKRNSFIPGKKFKRFDTNFIVSSILIFKYGKSNSSFLKWTSLYQIRNGKAAHYSKEKNDSKVKLEEIKSLIKFLEYTLNINYENNTNVAKGLKAKTFEESIEEAINRDPRFKKK